jgi:N-acyl-L-homoserine lactone synthetase
MQRYCCPSLFRNLAMETLGEISRFAISKRSRQHASASGPLLRLGLLHGILRASQGMGLTHWCALMAPSLLRLLQATGVHFAPLGPMVEAYGRRQPCFAAINLSLASGKRRRPDFYNWVAGERFQPSWPTSQQKTRLESSRVA